MRNTKTLEDIFLEATSDTWTLAEDEDEKSGTFADETVVGEQEEKEESTDVSDL